MENERILMSIEERLEKYRNGEAASPKSAAHKVLKIAATHPGLILYHSDINNIIELIGEYIDAPDVDIERYDSFCKAPYRAMVDGVGRNFPPEDARCAFEPLAGVTVNNVLLTLALAFIDNAKKSRKKQPIAPYLHMTLGDYLDALADLSFTEDGKLDEERVRSMRRIKEMVLEHYDSSKLLTHALADIVKDYVRGWQEYDHLGHIFRTMDGLKSYLEMEKDCRVASEDSKYEEDDHIYEEDDRIYDDPNGYFFSVAYEYYEEIPDFCSEEIPIEAYREEFFLPDDISFQPDELIKSAKNAVNEDFRMLLEEDISETTLRLAMRKINASAASVYYLLVVPYLEISRYHYERHLQAGTDFI